MKMEQALKYAAAIMYAMFHSNLSAHSTQNLVESHNWMTSIDFPSQLTHPDLNYRMKMEQAVKYAATIMYGRTSF